MMGITSILLIMIILAVLSLCAAFVLFLRSGEGASRLRLVSIALLCAGAAAAVSTVSALPAWQLLRSKTFDYLSTQQRQTLLDDSPVVVAIDEPSMADVNLRWPWPRRLHGELIEKLRAAGAKVIALDIIFSEPSSLAGDDAALEAAIGPDVVLAADQTLLVTQHAAQEIRTLPLQRFLDRGALPGIASIQLGADGVFRSLPSYADGFARQIARAAGVSITGPSMSAFAQVFGGARTYETVSYYQALNPETFLPAGFFKNRVVIVGLVLQNAPTIEAGGADAFATSYTVHTGHLTAGAEIQATIYDNLRSARFIEQAGTSLQFSFLALACLIAAAAVYRGTSLVTVLVGIAGVAAFGGISFLLIQAQRVFLSPLEPSLALLLILGGVASLDYARERKLRAEVTRAFSQYLSPDLVAQLARNPDLLRLGGERKTLTILFCDVRGFTTIAEGMKDDPTALTMLINRLLTPLSNVVLANRGTIDKYIGDCLMAFWNAPLPDDDHAVHAVKASLEMLEEMDKLNQALEAEAAANGLPFHPLRIGIGLNTGECVVGNMGSDKRFDYSALGDAVNLASRLEGTSKNYGLALLIGEATAALVKDRFAVLELDRVQVKGRSEKSPVFTVLKSLSEDSRALHARYLAARYSGHDDASAQLADTLAAELPAMAPYYTPSYSSSAY